MTAMKLAIVGGGPSAFYVASRLLTLLPQAPNVRIHIYDRLWAPHGLVRYGVAPDHPEVKNCTHKFDAAAADPRLRFFGNVHIGDPATNPLPHAVPLPLPALHANYTHLLLATGCTVPNTHPALPRSAYCVPALDLVHWYTQHPAAPPPPPLHATPHVTLVGNGNVALDVARMLLSAPAALARYDVPQPVLDVLERSAVRHVSIVARRGPLDAAFTTKELRELMHLPDAALTPLDPALLAPPADVKPTRQQSRILDILRTGSTAKFGSTPKSWSLDFFRSPTALAPPSPGAPATLTLAHTAVDPATRRAAPTGATAALRTSLVVPALGFRAAPADAYADPSRGHVPVRAGAVLGPGGPLPRVYASGWAATGAHGVLAATMLNAYATADAILADADAGAGVGADGVMATAPHLDDPPAEVRAALADGRVTEYADWRAVDAEEVRRGAERGKERERMGWEEAAAFLRARRAGGA